MNYVVKKEKVPHVLGCVGTSVFLIGVLMSMYGFEWVINDALKKQMSMEQDSENYKVFLVTPFPLLFKVYLFHVTNANQVQNGALPILKEKGPYVYSEYRRREGVVYSKEGDWVKYNIRKTFFFNQELSGCRSEDDEITLPNVALVSIAAQAAATTPEIIPVVNEVVHFIFPESKTIFSTVKVKDLLFDGVFLNCSNPEVDIICHGIKASGSKSMRPHENKRDLWFSMFHYMNDTDEGPFTMGLGYKNTTRGFLSQYQDSKGKTSVWRGDPCNAISGTDGTVFTPFNKLNKTQIHVYSTDICRSVPLDFEKEIEANGIRVYRYANREAALDDSDENKCFCVDQVNEDMEKIVVCPVKGTMNLLPCIKSVTIFSNPHFYLADKKLLKYARGLKPDASKHQNFAELEPAAELPAKFTDQLKLLYTALSVIGVMKVALPGLGLALMGVGAFMYARNQRLFCFGAGTDGRVQDLGDPTEAWGNANGVGLSEGSLNMEFGGVKTTGMRIPKSFDDRFMM